MVGLWGGVARAALLGVVVVLTSPVAVLSLDVTAAVADAAPPTMPTSVVPLLSRHGPEVTLAWVPSKDDVAVTGYHVYRDGSRVATVGLHPVFHDSSTQRGRTYVYTVRSRDAEGNLSTASARAKVKVPLFPAREEPARATRPLVGAVVQAMTSGYTDELRARAVDQVVATGLDWIRVGVQWSGIQPRQPTATDPGYDLDGAVAVLDPFVRRAHNAGLQVNVVLNSTPSWANGGKGPKALPTDPAHYARVARWAANRYRGTVQSFEVYNEPNLPLKLVATPAAYTRLLCAAHAGFRSGNPNALVVAGGTAGNDWEWYRGMYAAGARGCFDVLATHPYQAYSLPPDYPAPDRQRWWTDTIRLVRQVMVANGDGSVPVWFTEFGWSTHDNHPGMLERQIGVTRREQAEYTVDMMRRTVENYPYVRRAAIYQIRDAQVDNIRNDNYGLFNLDMRPKPAVTAVRAYLAGSP
jgi:polysaccharide biosynthesis protein PslG